MDKQRCLELLEAFKSVRVMAVGDIYLDEYVHGAITGISLEAPIPIFEVQERRYNPGAAGNAACNAASLGGQVTMVGVVGEDGNADIVKREFKVRNVSVDGVVTDASRPTNTYGKWRAGGHNIPAQETWRTDTPRPTMITGAVEDQVIERIRSLAPDVDAIMIGDQASATVSERVLAAILDCAREHDLVTVADSRERAGFFKDIDLITPNDKEAGLAAGVDIVDEETLHAAGRQLITLAKNAMITLGPDGIACFTADGAVEKAPVGDQVQAVDVTGAGDTVTAAATLTLAAGGTLLEAATLGNLAAGIAVAQTGVVTVPNDEVRAALTDGGGATNKLKTREQLHAIIKQLQQDGKRVVWTNGCFDILHVGHILYLQEARKQGDVMVVGLNSDASVRENKGADRPVVGEQDRAHVLAALECVSHIVIFDEKSPLPLLQTLQPDVYAKGGDYTVDTIVQEERRAVESYGGEIAIIPGRKGQSTSDIINKISGK